MKKEMHDMGQKSPECTSGPSGKNEKWYPSLDINNAEFMGNKKVGSEIDLHIRGEIKRVTKDTEGIRYEIKVKKAGLLADEDVGDNGGDEMERRFERARRKSVKQMDEGKKE